MLIDLLESSKAIGLCPMGNMVMLASAYLIFAQVCHKLMTLFIQAIKDNR